jgi:hypothetical protein
MKIKDISKENRPIGQEEATERQYKILYDILMKQEKSDILHAEILGENLGNQILLRLLSG